MLQIFLIGILSNLVLASLIFAEDNDVKNGNDQSIKNEKELSFDNDVSPIYKKEIKIEIEKLKRLRIEVEKKIKEDQKLLQKIKEEREKLRKEREEFEKFIKQVESERYKKLAKVFEKMDPELAGDKLSKMKDPKIAAYIIYNMKDRKAGEILNYVDPKMVDKITKILTDIKRKNKKTAQ